MDYAGIVFSVIQRKTIEMHGIYLIANRQGLSKRLKLLKIIEQAVPGLFFGICICVAIIGHAYGRQRTWEVTLT